MDWYFFKVMKERKEEKKKEGRKKERKKTKLFTRNSGPGGVHSSKHTSFKDKSPEERGRDGSELRALAIQPEVLSSIPSTHMVADNHLLCPLLVHAIRAGGTLHNK